MIETLTNHFYNIIEDTEVNVEWDTTKEYTITNELKKGAIRIIKVDKDNHEYKIAGAKFEVYDKNRNLLETIITDKNGNATTKKYSIRDYGELIIKEIETNEEFYLNDEEYTIKLEENQIKNVIFENERIKGTLEITKQDKNDKNKKLSGVVFGIYNEKDEQVQTITTNENGIATSDLMFKGYYYAKELSTGSIYYVLNQDIFKFEINKDNTDIKMTIVNEPVDITVDVEKEGDIEIKPGEYVNYSFSNVANTSNIYLDNFKWYDYIPAKYVRLETMTTGVWNQDLNYKVYYKTNKSEDYILFKENLNTQQNYDLDFTTLEFAEDEYIIEIYFDFGKVDKGFRETISPTMICKSLETLQNNQTFTNKTKTVGIYGDLTAESNSKWTTIIHIPEEKTEEKLPRTGK